MDDLTVEETKILEQALINANGGVDFLDNLINGMTESNPLYPQIDNIGQTLLAKFNKIFELSRGV